DTVTDYSRPSPTIESSPDDAQNKNPSTKTGTLDSTILSKPVIKFVNAANKATERPTTDKVKTAKKPAVRYAELYRKPTKKPTVRGNQRNWNNLKSQQLEKRYTRELLDFRIKLMRVSNPDLLLTDHTDLQKLLTGNSNVSTVCCCCSRHVNTARPKAVINRRNWVNDVKALACWVWKPIKSNSASIILKRYDYVDVRGRSMYVMAWVPKKDWFSKRQLRDKIKRLSEDKKKQRNKKLEDSKAKHQV
nr:hypothetical protein [Tanacetum cinerariifolium]